MTRKTWSDPEKRKEYYRKWRKKKMQEERLRNMGIFADIRTTYVHNGRRHFQ